MCRSQWPHGLRSGSVAARLQRFGFQSRQGHGCLALLSVVCCKVEVSASGWSLAQNSPTDVGVSEGDNESSTMKRSWPTTAVGPREKKIYNPPLLPPTFLTPPFAPTSHFHW